MRPSGARAAPLPFIALLGALSFLPRIAAAPRLRLAFIGAAVALLVWFAVLAWRRRLGAVEPVLRKNHYIQPVLHLSILIYWGWHWPQVYDAAWLIVGQIAFVYAFDMLLSWTMGRKAWLSFGPIPIVFSTNLFLWFKDDWFFLQFVMLAVGMMGRALIQWEREGRRTHVFNPSAFALSVFSVGLIAFGAHDLTWGPEISFTQARPDHIYPWIFAVGLVVQWFFQVTLMTFSAAATCWAMSAVFTAFTGTYYFVDTAIPIAVFLGMHLLFTDPSTSPRSAAGRVVFGALYGASVFGLYAVFEAVGVPSFYDKLLPVPILNLAVRAIDRTCARVDWSRFVPQLNARAANLVHMSLWATTFAAMMATDAVGNDHPGLDPAFWARACDEHRFDACRVHAAVVRNRCDDGVAADCTRFGDLLRDGAHVPHDATAAAAAWSRACEAGEAVACARVAEAIQDGRGVPPNPALAATLFRMACEGGHTPACGQLDALARSLEADLERQCEAGNGAVCTRLAELDLDRRNPAANHERARRRLERACSLGDPPGCADLGRMHQLGDGIPKDEAAARAAFARACSLGFTPACRDAGGAR